jgi:hypothetical protein
MRNTAALLLALLVAATAAGVGAEEEKPTEVEISIDDLNVGTHWYGPEVTAKDLAGKVVLVELWGS